MNSTALFWLLANLTTIVCLAFFSMFEMAAVSFNKVRLHFYVSRGFMRAKWLTELLQNPSKLFATTLIGVNVSMFIGSECAREFHEALGIDPNWTPLSQVLLVIIFGELAPMFAARHYPETVAMAGIPIVYLTSKLLSPAIYFLSLISKFANKLIGNDKPEEGLFLSQEELQKILEEQDEESPHESEKEDINAISANIFRLRKKLIKDVMTPLSAVASLPSNATIAQTLNLIKKNDFSYVPIYHNRKENIIGIAKPRDLIRATEAKRIRDYARPPWFITENSRLTDVLKQFKRSQENIAVILNDRGVAVGIVTLDALLKEIFGQGELQTKDNKSEMNYFLKDKTFPGSYTVREFQNKYGTQLSKDENLTFSELIKENLSHTVEVGDKVTIGNVELVVKEASFLEVKSVLVTSWPR